MSDDTNDNVPEQTPLPPENNSDSDALSNIMNGVRKDASEEKKELASFVPAILESNTAIAEKAKSVDAYEEQNKQMKLALIQSTKDIETGRNINIDMQQQILAHMTNLSQLALDTQNPRAYEVLGQLMKLAMDVNDQNMKMASEKMKLANTLKKSMQPEEAASGGGGNVIHNHLHVSTTQLQKMLDKRDGKISDDEIEVDEEDDDDGED